MKSTLFIFAAAVALASPALAQQASRDPGNTGAIPANPYSNYREPTFGRTFMRDPSADDIQCFNGKFLSGANRIGDKVLLLQSKNSNVFRATLNEPCPALDAAKKLRVRSEGSYRVCNAGRAVLTATTATGTKSCLIRQVRVLNDREIASLSTSRRR